MTVRATVLATTSTESATKKGKQSSNLQQNMVLLRWTRTSKRQMNILSSSSMEKKAAIGLLRSSSQWSQNILDCKAVTRWELPYSTHDSASQTARTYQTSAVSWYAITSEKIKWWKLKDVHFKKRDEHFLNRLRTDKGLSAAWGQSRIVLEKHASTTAR